MQHSNVSYPVIGVLWQDGYPTNIRRQGGGTLVDAGVAYVNELIQSLPQNATALQRGNHAIAEDCGRRPSAIGVGQPAGMGDGVRGSEAK